MLQRAPLLGRGGGVAAASSEGNQLPGLWVLLLV